MKFTFAPESKPLEGYTIKRAIYRGGFGEVYYALTDAGREVALKLLQNNTEIELRGVQQCLNLSHPNLVTIFDIRQDGDGDHWIVMEYVAGETLDKAIRRFPQGMPMEEIRRWLPGISAGVAFLHEHGLVHRDLKPANIFSDTGTVKIGDVGLSKFITPSRRSAQTQSVGTVYYMAPEVAKGRYGKEVDVYAMGIILYEMLTGQVPFDGDSTGEILMKHLTERPDLKKLPPRLRPVIAMALEKDPARRFSNMGALSRAFDDAVLGRGADPSAANYPPPPPPPPPAEPKQPRGPWSRHPLPAGDWTPRDLRPPHLKSSDPRDLATTALKWVFLAFLFSWIGWGFLVPVAAILAGVFGIMFAWHAITWSAGSLAGAVTGAFRDVRMAASAVGLAAHKAAGVAVAAPVAAGNAVKAAAGCCARKVSSPLAIPPTPALTRWTQWTGAATMAPLLILAFTAVLAFVWPRLTPSQGAFAPTDLPQLATFAMAGILSSWAITGVSKFWDGSRSGFFPRVSLGIAGLAVGAAVWNLEQFLHAGITGQPMLFQLPPGGELTRFAHDLKIAPGMLATMILFGALFFVRNWRRQTSVTRNSRLRIGSMAMSAIVAAPISGIMEAPVELMMTWAAVLSATVQVASAWSPVDPTARMAA